MGKQIRLTDAQVYTLRRMKNGTRYFMQGNAKRGDEDNGFRRINSPSLPVLFRYGLVDFCSDAVKEPTKWYSVKLTVDGMSAALLAQTKNN